MSRMENIGNLSRYLKKDDDWLISSEKLGAVGRISHSSYCQAERNLFARRTQTCRKCEDNGYSFDFCKTRRIFMAETMTGLMITSF